MNDAARPDPDAPVAQLRADESRARRGRPRIYFGANAGVGKTWAMLSAAQRERAAGPDLVIGVVETHGCAETAALLAGIDALPPRQIAHRDRDRELAEFDLDAALARRCGCATTDRARPLAGHEPTLFDKFTCGQAESAMPGVGLGLAICKAVVTAHGGDMSTANAPGGGAEFSVSLPRRVTPEAADLPA